MLRIPVTIVAFLVSVTLAAPALAAVNDHLKCYQVKDPLNLAAVVDLDSPQFGLEAGCKVSKAKFFCVPATKTVVSAEDKKTHLPITPLPVGGPDPGDRVCYKVKCPEPFPPDTQVTDQFGTRTLGKFKTALLCNPAVKGTPAPTPTATPGPGPRFVDNGDGTVTDNQTGLQWEKKTTTVGSGVNFADAHDVDNFYTWGNLGGCSFTGCLNGTAFTDFLGRLNNCTSTDGTAVTTAGFAGHCDWRLPTIQELQSIVDLTQGNCGGGSGPCIYPVFGPSVASNCWSATIFASSPTDAWFVVFSTGAVGNGGKVSNLCARAVRTGS